MDKRMPSALVVACVVAVLAACAVPRGGDGMHDRGKPRYNDQVCNASATNCEIDVRIECAAQCVGVVDPKVLLVMRGSEPKIIRWKLTGMHQDYEFKDVPIISGESAFECDRPGQHQKQAVCKDTFAGTKTDFEYEIHVVKSSGGPELTIDPWIVNR